jgi:hypothetical protein
MLDLYSLFPPEPGYYEDGKFGIRIENIVIVRKVETRCRFGDVDYLGFEHVTMVRRVSVQHRFISFLLSVSHASKAYRQVSSLSPRAQMG